MSAARAERLVIGGGAAGLAAAAAMARAGRAVLVLDKGRGLGGRLATRRPFARERYHPWRGLIIDHGAPAAHGSAAPFDGAQRWDRVTAQPRFGLAAGAAPAWVWPRGMAELLTPAPGVVCRTGVEATAVARAGDRVRVTAREGEATLAFEADAVICAVPAPQAAVLLRGLAPSDAVAAEYAPVWSVLAVWAAADARAAPDVVWGEGEPLEAAIAQAAKPGGAALCEGAAAWVGHATDSWSRAHLEADQPAVAEALLRPLSALAGAEVAPRYVAAHRWRYARVTRAAGSAFWRSEDGRLGLCGDWRLGSTVAHALESGDALGAAMS